MNGLNVTAEDCRKVAEIYDGLGDRILDMHNGRCCAAGSIDDGERNNYAYTSYQRGMQRVIDKLGLLYRCGAPENALDRAIPPRIWGNGHLTFVFTSGLAYTGIPGRRFIRASTIAAKWREVACNIERASDGKA